MESDESATGPYVAVALRQFEKGKALCGSNHSEVPWVTTSPLENRHRLDQLRPVRCQ